MISYCIGLRVNVQKMAPLDWNRLMQLQVNDLAEDEQRADDLYEVLGEVGIATCYVSH